MRASTRRLALVASLAAVVLLSGCGGPDDPAAHPPSTSESPSTTASTTASPTASAADAVATLVQTGLDQLEGGNRQSARRTFESVLTLDPVNVYAHYNLGLIAQRAGQDDRAVTQYDAALESDPGFAPALFNRGILTESADLDAAIELYRRAVAADPEFAAAFMRLGFALVHEGRSDEGESYLAQGIALDPSMTNVAAPTYTDAGRP